MKRIAWITNDWSANPYRTAHDLYGGLGYYRVIKPAQILSKWYDIDVIGADFQFWGIGNGDPAYKYQRFEQYDLIIFKQMRTIQDASNIMATAKYYKKPILIDLDDNYLAIRKDNPAYSDYEYGNGPAEHLSALVSLVSGVIVSTAPLKKLYKSLNKNIDVLPNCNDVKDWPNVRKQWDDGKVRIGFCGGAGHLADLVLIIEPMAYILAKYPNVIFEICGAITPQEAMSMVTKMNELCKKDVSTQVRIAGGTEGQVWQGYPELLTSFGWDIVVAPAIDDEFNRCKSHNRWLESSMIYAPVIASQVYPYYKNIQGVKTIQDGKTGLFARNSQEWFKQLDSLIQNKDLRYQIATNSYEYVKENWQYEQWALKWKRVIEKYAI